MQCVLFPLPRLSSKYSGLSLDSHDGEHMDDVLLHAHAHMHTHTRARMHTTHIHRNGNSFIGVTSVKMIKRV